MEKQELEANLKLLEEKGILEKTDEKYQLTHTFVSTVNMATIKLIIEQNVKPKDALNMAIIQTLLATFKQGLTSQQIEKLLLTLKPFIINQLKVLT